MTSSLDCESATFSVQIENNCAVVTLRDGAFVLGTDLEEKERFQSAMSSLEEATEVQAIVFFDPGESLGDGDHRESIARVKSSPGTTAGRAVRQHENLFRAENSLNQFVLRLIESTKLIVTCPEGPISSPFFGVSLASDLRFVAPDLRFCLSHVELGVPPTGALAFLLPRFVGQGRAIQILLGGGTIDADQALDLGLVSQVIADDDFRGVCL